MEAYSFRGRISPLDELGRDNSTVAAWLGDDETVRFFGAEAHEARAYDAQVCPPRASRAASLGVVADVRRRAGGWRRGVLRLCAGRFVGARALAR